MRHKPETIIYAAGWLESQFEVWKEKAIDEAAQKIVAQAEEMFKTVSEGVFDALTELAQAQRQLAVVRSLVRTSAEEQLDAIRNALTQS